MLVSPFPLEEFFAFCLIPIFCSKIFSLPQSFSSLAQPFTHACKHRTEQRCFWTPLSSSFFDAVFLLIPHFLFNREKKTFYLVNEIKLGAMEFAQSIRKVSKNSISNSKDGWYIFVLLYHSIIIFVQMKFQIPLIWAN